MLERKLLIRFLLLVSITLLSVEIFSSNQIVESKMDWKEKVKEEHPRLFFTNSTLYEVQKRALDKEKDVLDAIRLKIDDLIATEIVFKEPYALDGTQNSDHEYGFRAAESALLYNILKEKKYLDFSKELLEKLVDYYELRNKAKLNIHWYSFSRIATLCAFDWIYNDLSQLEKETIGNKLLISINDMIYDGSRSKYFRENTSNYDEGFYGCHSLSWFAGLVFYKTGINDSLAEQLLLQGYENNMNLLAHRKNLSGDDGGAATATLQYCMIAYPWAEFNFFHTFKSATGIDIAQNWDYILDFLYYIYWNRLPNDLHFGYGDAFHYTNDLPLKSMHIHLSQILHFYGKSNHKLLFLANDMRSILSKDPTEMFSFMRFFLDDSLMSVSPFKFQGSAMHFENMGQIFMRSGTGNNDTYAVFTAGSKVSQHKHYDDNNFIIYKRGFRTLDTGTRPEPGLHLSHYYCRTIAHNCILINMPNEEMPEYWGGPALLEKNQSIPNDGGQCELLGSEVTGFEENEDYVYIASDATNAYHKDKAGLVIRQFLFVQPDVFIVFDRVTSLHTEYKKTWLLHTVSEPQIIESNEFYEESGDGRLFCRTLLPKNAKTEKIGGNGKQFWSDGKNWSLPKLTTDDWNYNVSNKNMADTLPLLGQWRVEISPKEEKTEDNFLHLLQVGDRTLQTMISSQLIEVDDQYRICFEYNLRNYEIAFNTKGQTGGYIKIMEDGELIRDEAFASTVKPQSVNSRIITLKYDANPSVKNDFMDGKSIGEKIEQVNYTGKDDAIIDNKWHLSSYYQKVDGSSPLTVTPLYYNGYIESGKTNALEMLMLSESGNSTSRHTGYSLTSGREYASGTHYLSFMVKVSSSMWSGDDNAKGFIMFNGSHTSDFKRIVCYVKKVDANNVTFGLRETDVDYNSSDASTFVSYSNQNYSFNDTHLLVMKYNFDTRKAELFINSPIQPLEPNSNVKIDILNNDFNNAGIQAITLRQRRNHSQKIGGLRLAKTWHDVMGFDLDDDEHPHIQGSYDYSTIAPHPRLIMNKQEEVLLKENLQKNKNLQDIHKMIIRIADKTLTEDTLKRVLEGKRLLTVSRTAIYRIFYLSYAYRMTLDSKYLERAEKELLAVCRFSDWNPSHFLDVGEMSMAVAIGYDWLFYDLQAETKKIIRTALQEKAFIPSKNKEYNFFLNNTANWNQVCNTGLTYAALAIYESAKEASVEIIERCLETIKLPLNDYAPDGNYLEGYMYWAYGTSFQIMLFAALESALGNDLDLHLTPGFMDTAEYMLFMSGGQGQCFNYSDANTDETPLIPMFWFAQKGNNPNLLYIEKQKLQKGDYMKSFSENRLLPALLVFANNINLDAVQPPLEKMWVGHGRTPVALIHTDWGKSSDKYLGIKGGNASTSHGHMDAGSFVYEVNGERWAIDLGLQNYLSLESKGIDLWNMGQSSERWDVFRYNNKAHNTLTINDKYHLVDGVASITQVYDTDAERGVDIDMTSVLKNEVQSALRKVAIINSDYLLVKDKVKTKNQTNTTLRWSMVTSAKPIIEDTKTFKLEQNGKLAYLSIESDLAFDLKTWSTEPITTYDEENPGSVIVGFESHLPPNKECVFTVKLSAEKDSLSGELFPVPNKGTIESIQYFSLTGAPIFVIKNEGIFIKKIIYSNGFIEAKKVIVFGPIDIK